MSINGPEELEGMRAAGAVVRLMLEAMKEEVCAGITTRELDEIGARVMCRHGAQSAPALVYSVPGHELHQRQRRGRARHTRQSQDSRRRSGEARCYGREEWLHGGCGRDRGSGRSERRIRRLLECARRAFTKAMLVARAGYRVSEIGRAVEREVRRSGFSVIRDLGGHGIGRTIHEEPRIPTMRIPKLARFHGGMVITVEPIIAAGSGRAVVARDGWTVRTADGRCPRTTSTRW